MKLFVSLLIALSLSSGCKKTIERIKEDAILDAMTDGQWVITSFSIDGVDHTADFSTYKFQYFRNKTVQAINNGSVEKTGNWDGDADAMTTSADFPSATSPISWLNGTWHIDNNSWTFVVASLVTGGETRNMRLEKL